MAITSAALGLGLAELAVRRWVPVRDVGPSFTVYDPIYGKRLKRNFHALRYASEFTMSFTTNSLGFRGPELPSTHQRPLLFIGDSYTMGYGVNDGQEFPAVVRRAYQQRGLPIPVINAGMGANGNGFWVKFLRNQGRQLNPRVVVLQISENDFGDNVREGLFTLSPNGELVENRIAEPGWQRIVQRVIEAIPGLSYSYLVGLSRQLPDLRHGGSSQAMEVTPADEAGGERTDSLTYRLIEEILDICRNEHWPVLALEVRVEGAHLDELQGIFRRRGVSLIMVPERSTRPDLYYRIDGHWNIRGHELVAEEILERLDSMGAPKPARQLSSQDFQETTAYTSPNNVR